MEHILAILNHESTGDAVLSVARKLAERLRRSQIAVLHPRRATDPSFMPSEEVMTDRRQEEFDQKCARQSAVLQELYERWHASLEPTISTRWIEIVGDPVRTITTEAPSADLLVVGHALPDNIEDGSLALKASLYDAAAAVVIAPMSPPSTVGSHPAIAWKSSAAVDLAISAALPILATAEDVTILIDGDHEPETLLRTLEQAEIPWRVARFSLDGQDIGDALLEQARAHRADLLIMGGYTHSRFVEMLLGGATREVLAKADMPLLIHH